MGEAMSPAEAVDVMPRERLMSQGLEKQIRPWGGVVGLTGLPVTRPPESPDERPAALIMPSGGKVGEVALGFRPGQTGSHRLNENRRRPW